MTIHLQAADWWALFGQYLMMSLLSISGAITMVPEMHRYLVERHGWLTDPQFSASVAIAQAAPGPNVLFVALMGWQVGLNAGGGPDAGIGAWMLAALGLSITMTGILLPSSLLSYLAAQWSQRNRHRRSVRAFRQGMGPLIIGLLIATGWVLVNGGGETAARWTVWATAGVTALIVWRTKIHLLWLLGAGAVIGGMGWL